MNRSRVSFARPLLNLMTKLSSNLVKLSLRSVLALLAFTIFIQNQASAQSRSREVTVWEVVEFPLTLPSVRGNPFDMHPVLDCVGPGGKRMSVPGFYTGGNTYAARVSFPETGLWRVSSKETDDGWTVAVLPNSSPTLGPVVVNPDTPQKFHYANGESCFVLAFEADWLFAVDLETDSLERTKTLLRDIKANGFNQIVMNVYAHDVRWPKDPNLPEKYEFARPRQWPYGGSNDEPDYSRLNLDFFSHFDAVIEEMNALDLTAHIMIYVWNKQVNWPDSDSVEDNRYFDYVVARYQAYPNIIWDISKEATGYGHNDMNYIVRRIKRLREMDGHDRLVTVHSFSYCAKYPDTVDFISYQNWSASLYNRMLETYREFSDKPIFNIEHGGYEIGPYHVFDGDYDDPVACLDRNYQCVFGGTYSTYYWQNTSWDVVIWDRSELPESERPRYELYRHMAQLFKDVDFGSFEPPKTRITSSGMALESADGRCLIYLPAANKRVNTRIEPYYGKTMKAKWFNPLTGEYSPETRPVMEKWLRFEPPWQDQPMVLILEP